MRRAVMLGSAALLAACSDAPSAPGAIAPAAGPRAEAVTFTRSAVIPFQVAAFVPCANDGEGELVILTGDQHVLVHATITENGNTRFVTHLQSQNVTGTGVTTGDRYRFIGLNQLSQGSEGPFPITFNFVDNFRVIGQGPDNNIWVHQNAHFTVNANGEFTAIQENIKAHCNTNP